MQGKGYRTSWDSYKGAFRSGYADAEWDDATLLHDVSVFMGDGSRQRFVVREAGRAEPDLRPV